MESGCVYTRDSSSSLVFESGSGGGRVSVLGGDRPSTVQAMRCDRCGTHAFNYFSKPVEKKPLRCVGCDSIMKEGRIYLDEGVVWDSPGGSFRIGGDVRDKQTLSSILRDIFGMGVADGARSESASLCRNCKLLVFKY